MSKKCIIEIRDEVNIRLTGLDPSTRRQCSNKLSYFLPHAYHMPAFKLGRWDGKVKYCDIGGRTFLNLLDEILPIIISEGYELDINDQRDSISIEFELIAEDFWGDSVWPVGHKHEGEKIRLRDYQVEIVNRYMNNPQSLQEVATGAGKTIITATLSKIAEKYGRTIVIVPNKDLVTQTEADYINVGLDVGVYFGDRKDEGKTHTICTWQSLESLVKKTKKGEANAQEFVEDVICVMVDEAHGAKADVLKDLLTGIFANVPLRWGLTGTIPKNDWEFASLHAAIGPVINRLSAKELQDQGVLSNLHVNILQTQEMGSYGNYASEVKFLTSDKIRLAWIAKQMAAISQDGNTLVLVNRIETGEELQELIPNSKFVRGAMKGKDRKDAYDDINASDNTVTIATYGVAAVGLNIPRIFNMVLIEPGKSFVRVIQSIGRGVRTAKDKDFVNIWDITSRTKYSKKHLTERKKFYKDAQYEFSVTKIDYTKE